jgi:lipopolysaccharide/colanic/teichoic acid biosynthesis glycosyltransferase
MVKRSFDVLIAGSGLLVLSPVLGVLMLLIWLQDFCSPFYVAPRARGRDSTFNMVKLRSMVKNADRKGGASTAANDRRITWVGKLIRKSKFDEVPQLWNVLRGDMSLVGPRPQVPRDIAFYTEAELRLFAVRPGITDFASIVFADEGEILKGSGNPDLEYNRIIRPWKSRLGLFYVDHHTFLIDLLLISLTMKAIVSRKSALPTLQRLLRRLGAEEQLIIISGRTVPLQPFPPPGATTVETRC